MESSTRVRRATRMRRATRAAVVGREAQEAHEAHEAHEVLGATRKVRVALRGAVIRAVARLTAATSAHQTS